MLDLKIAEISASSGAQSDGIFRGNISQSTLLGAFNNLFVSTSVYAIRKDTSGSNYVYTDVSTLAVGDVDNGFLPWGTDAEFSAGDEIWLADVDKDINEIYVQITTPGVWTGTGLSVLESIDGDTLVSVGNLVDGSNGFRNAAGVYKISFNANADNRKSITPEFGLTKRKYLVIRPNGFVSKTTSPKFKRVWLVSTIVDDSWTDYTSVTNAALTSSDFSSISSQSIFPIVGSEARFAFSKPTIGAYDAIYRGVPNNYTTTVDYLASDNTWKAISDYVDYSNNFTNVSTTFSTTPTYYYKKWSMPSDWAAKELTLSGQTITAYWIRRRIATVSTYGPIPIYLYRRRALSLGDTLSNGIYFKDAATLSYVTYYIGTPSTSDTVIAFSNATSGQSKSVTIPGNSFDSASLTSGRLDFDSSLNVGAGEELLISHVKGLGTLQDVEIHLSLG